MHPADGLAGHHSQFYLALISERVRAMAELGPHANLQIGTWLTPQPLVNFRTARIWADRSNANEAAVQSQWADLINRERSRGREIAAYLLAFRDAELTAIADSVVTLADLQADVPLPIQGVPWRTR